MTNLLTADVKSFLDKAAVVLAFAKESPLIPIFEFVHIGKDAHGAVMIRASNYAGAISTELPLIKAPEQSMLIHAPTLLGMLQTLSGVATIEQKGNIATLKCGGFKMDFQAHPPGDFPMASAFPEIDPDGIFLDKVDMEVFSSSLGRLEGFLSQDDMVMWRSNALLGPNGSYAAQQAMFVKITALKTPNPVGVNIGTNRWLSKLLSAGAKWAVGIHEETIWFSRPGAQFRRKQLAFDAAALYAQIDGVMATHQAKTPIASFVAGPEFKAALQRVAILKPEWVGITSRDDGDMGIVAGNTLTGASLTEQIQYSGIVDFVVRVGPKYVLDALSLYSTPPMVHIIPQGPSVDTRYTPLMLLTDNNNDIVVVINSIAV